MALAIKTFLFQAFFIPSASMAPTLNTGDRVLVYKLGFDLGDVDRGDMVVFEKPDGADDGNPEVKDLIKRVVALPGETIEGRDGQVVIDDQLLEEPYLPPGTVTLNLERTTVPEGHVWVMGDNRGDSRDSRAFGAIDGELLIGRAFFRVWPLAEVGFL